MLLSSIRKDYIKLDNKSIRPNCGIPGKRNFQRLMQQVSGKVPSVRSNVFLSLLKLMFCSIFTVNYSAFRASRGAFPLMERTTCNLASHTTYVTFVNFIYEWQYLQYASTNLRNLSWEFHFLWENSAERKSPKNELGFFTYDVTSWNCINCI